MTHSIASGHPYDPATQTGIEWKPNGEVFLHRRSEPRSIGSHTTSSAYQYWHTLGFQASFPDVTHWYFGSAWTGNVRFSLPVQQSDTEYEGYMQFTDEQTNGLPYTITQTGQSLTVSVPLPPMHVVPQNLVLRRTLAEVVLVPVIQALAPTADVTGSALAFSSLFVDPDSIAPDRWIGVTSLVARDDLALMFPESAIPWWTLVPFTDGSSFRSLLCRVQGLHNEQQVS